MEATDSASSSQPAAPVASSHVLRRQVAGLVIWLGVLAGPFVARNFGDWPAISVVAYSIFFGVIVFVDAWRAGVHKVSGSRSLLNMSPMSWGILVALVFPFTGPVYLFNRGKLRSRECSPIFFIIAGGLWGAAVVAWLVLLVLRLTGTV